MDLNLRRSILLTLSYTQYFLYPLKPIDLYVRLIVNKRISSEKFAKNLKVLIDSKKIEYFENYLFVSGLTFIEKQKLVELRKNRHKISFGKWQDASKFLEIATYIPFITGIAVTGSLSVNNVAKDDDVDFMIITKKHRLWITRLLVIFIASWFGKRRSFAQEEKNSWCFNLWIEETDLKLPPESRSIYEAYEVSQAIWVLSENNLSNAFYLTNKWVGKFIYFYRIIPKLNIQKIFKSRAFFDDSFFGISKIFSLINFICFIFQYSYMKRHITREKVSYSHAFFHPRNTKKQIFLGWKQILSKMIQ